LATGDATPSTVTFGWGPNIIMDEAIVTSVSVAYERFLLGMPVRATATVTLKAVPLPFPLGATNPSSGGLATLRTRTVVEGDTLASIAFQEYKDPNKWRALAEANQIDDPMRVKEGTVLMVPDRREAENLS
jgi:nucleoid-associated protein YgaU